MSSIETVQPLRMKVISELKMINRLMRRPSIVPWRRENQGKGLADIKIINSSRLLRMQATEI